MLKKLLVFMLAMLVSVMNFGTYASATTRAIRQQSTRNGYAYKAYTTNMDYEMITNGKDGEIWIIFNSKTESNLYRFEGAVDDLYGLEQSMLKENIPYTTVDSFFKNMFMGDIDEAFDILLNFFNDVLETESKINEASDIVSDILYYYDALLPHEAPESKNDCVWNGGSWVCKYTEVNLSE